MNENNQSRNNSYYSKITTDIDAYTLEELMDDDEAVNDLRNLKHLHKYTTL